MAQPSAFLFGEKCFVLGAQPIFYFAYAFFIPSDDFVFHIICFFEAIMGVGGGGDGVGGFIHGEAEAEVTKTAGINIRPVKPVGGELIDKFKHKKDLAFDLRINYTTKGDRRAIRGRYKILKRGEREGQYDEKMLKYSAFSYII